MKMSMKDTINQLIEALDADTLEKRNRYMPLILMGDVENSPFLRAIIRKAGKLGIKTEVTNTPQHKYPVIVDRETCEVDYVEKRLDIDNLFHEGMSCVAEAVLLLLYHLDLIYCKNICIVGRGHSVKGLVNALLEHDATVTIAHSKTKSLLYSTMAQDVVIYATPPMDELIAYDTTELIVDVGNSVKHPDWFCCDYTNEIGKLTVSVLLNRFVNDSW